MIAHIAVIFREDLARPGDESSRQDRSEPLGSRAPSEENACVSGAGGEQNKEESAGTGEMTPSSGSSYSWFPVSFLAPPGEEEEEKDHAKQREARKDVVPALAGSGVFFLENFVQKKLGEPSWKRRGNVFAFFALLCVKQSDHRPSRLGRRMSDGVIHLTENVLPEV